MNKHDRPRTMLLFPCASVWKRQSDWPNSYVKYYAGYVPGASGVKVGNGTGATSTLPMVMIADSSPAPPAKFAALSPKLFSPAAVQAYEPCPIGRPTAWEVGSEVSGVRCQVCSASRRGVFP